MRKSNQGWHTADIVAAVKKSGTSLRRLSIENGFAPSTLRAALHRRHPKAQTVIAKLVGCSRHQIWPEWYDAADQLRPLSPFQRRSFDRNAA